jgi:hypothetical protein
MEDRVAQFFLTVAKLCADASLGRLSVRVSLKNGEHLVGVPAPPPESQGPDQLDGTGYADTVSIDDTDVALSDVIEATVRYPVRVLTH